MGIAKQNPVKCTDCCKILNTRTRSVARCWLCFRNWCIKTKRHPTNFKGFILKQNGYRCVYVNKDKPMMLEHRYFMEQHIRRELKPTEIVHHINGIRDDNRIENLTITTRKNHEHCTLIKQLQKRIKELEQLLEQLNVTTAA